jgi:hypothetical protein
MRRFLTQREADRCENAREPVCKCRCGGAKHGAARVPSGDFSELPMDDPHYRPMMTRKELKEFLADADFTVILCPSPDLPEESWINGSWKWRTDACIILREARNQI